MNDKIRAYPNGFLFNIETVDLNNLPHYNYLNVCGYNYYFDNDSTKQILEKDNHFIIIHGLYMHLDLEQGDISDSSAYMLLNLYMNDYEEFLNELDYTAGRHCIIIGNKDDVKIYPDATASRSVYYSVDFKAAASHTRLLNEVYTLESDPLNKVQNEYRINGENNIFMNVKSIISNFYFDFHKNEKVRFWPRQNNRFTYTKEKVKLELASKIWKLQLDKFTNEYKHVVMSMTGGLDSRVSLALLNGYYDKVLGFTYTPSTRKDFQASTSWEKSIFRDKKIVDELLEIVNIKHRYLDVSNKELILNEDEVNILNKNTITHHGRFVLPLYKKELPFDDLLHIRGNLLEIGRSTHISTTTENTIEDMEKKVISFLTKNIKKDNKYYNILKHTATNIVSDYQYHKYSHDFHLMDLLYWENRHARWLSEILNETDFSFETFLPFNNRMLIEISLSYPLHKRKNAYFFNELINKNNSILNFHSKNKLLNLYEEKRYLSNIALFNSLDYYNENNELIGTYNTNNNTIFVPTKYLGNKNYASFKTNFKMEKGILQLSYRNPYFNAKANKYFLLKVLVNGNLIYTDDVCKWNDEVDVLIPNLTKGDQIDIQLQCNKELYSLSWEKASRTIITRYSEKINSNNLVSIESSSPYFKLEINS